MHTPAYQPTPCTKIQRNAPKGLAYVQKNRYLGKVEGHQWSPSGEHTFVILSFLCALVYTPAYPSYWLPPGRILRSYPSLERST